MLLLIGLWLLAAPVVSPIITKKRNLRRIKNRGQLVEQIQKNEVIRFIEKLLVSSINVKSPYATLTFFFGSFGLFFSSLILLIQTNNKFGMILTFSLVIGCTPTIILLLIRRNKVIDGSYEAIKVTSELMNQYKLCNMKMDEAIDQTVKNLESSFKSKIPLARLNRGIIDFQDKEELVFLLEEFNYSMGTKWGAMLSNNIQISLEDGTDVEIALDDILEQLREIKNVNENQKRVNAEAFLIIKFVAPFLYLGSIWIMFNYFNFTVEKFLQYQFYDPKGFSSFVITMILIVINYVVYQIVKKPKFDF
jgi:predicted hydrocarbon binding protein